MPRWRPFTWVLLVINALAAYFIISGIVATNRAAGPDCAGLDADSCDAATTAGTVIGVIILVFALAMVDVILGIIWLVTRPKTRDCLGCGNKMARGVVQCSTCGWSALVQPMPPTRPPDAGYPVA